MSDQIMTEAEKAAIGEKDKACVAETASRILSLIDNGVDPEVIAKQMSVNAKKYSDVEFSDVDRFTAEEVIAIYNLFKQVQVCENVLIEENQCQVLLGDMLENADEESSDNPDRSDADPSRNPTTDNKNIDWYQIPEITQDIETLANLGKHKSLMMRPEQGQELILRVRVNDPILAQVVLTRVFGEVSRLPGMKITEIGLDPTIPLSKGDIGRVLYELADRVAAGEINLNGDD